MDYIAQLPLLGDDFLPSFSCQNSINAVLFIVTQRETVANIIMIHYRVKKKKIAGSI